MKKNTQYKFYGCLAYFLSMQFVGFAQSNAGVESDDPIVLKTTNFHLLATEGGQLSYIVMGEQMEQHQSGNMVANGAINMTVIEHPEGSDEVDLAMSISIRANQLTYHPSSGVCVLSGDVQIKKPLDDLSITTESISYDTKNGFLFTDHFVQIHQNHNLLKGTHLYATKDLKSYSLDGPDGAIEVEHPISS